MDYWEFQDEIENGRVTSKLYDKLRTSVYLQYSFFMGQQQNGILLADGDSDHTSADRNLDRWVSSDEGLETLAALVMMLQQVAGGLYPHALPAHDARQIGLKDAAEAIRFNALERPQGYKQTSVIPTSFHDIGRLLEGFLVQNFDGTLDHKDWIPHAQLSFWMMKSVLQQQEFEGIPAKLKNHFLYAVAAHSGDDAKTYMGRVVQTCDRMQLWEAEGLFRALSYGAAILGADIHYPRDAAFARNLPSMFDHKSVLSMMEYFARNMRPCIGSKGLYADRQTQLEIGNLALLIAATQHDRELYNTVFAPETGQNLSFGDKKGKIAPVKMPAAEALLKAEYRRYFNGLANQSDLSGTIASFLTSPEGAAPLSDSMRANIANSVARMTPEEQTGLLRAMLIAHDMRTRHDLADKIVLETARNWHQPAYIKAIAGKAISFLPHCSRLSPQVPATLAFAR